VNADFQYAVKMVESLAEQLQQSIWTEAERAELELNLKIARADLGEIKASLREDGFDQSVIDALERQFVAKYMEGSQS